MRPGTNELYIGDVGWSYWEEINRLPNPTAGVRNFGWPCYEGTFREPSYEFAGLKLCQDLYAEGASAHTPPHYTYEHSEKVVPGESCPTGSSATAGLDFYTSGPFPDAYDGALFFADYTRDCIWVMFPGANGVPDPATRQTFVAGAANPVDLQVGPTGDLFYADLDGGTIRRIRFPNNAPTARATATPSSGAAPLTVAFDGRGSSDPDPADTLTYAWDLDNDGAFDDGGTAQPGFTYPAGVHTARLRVTDPAGASDTTAVTIQAGTPPTATIETPTSATRVERGPGRRLLGLGARRRGRPAAGEPADLEPGDGALLALRPAELPHAPDPGLRGRGLGLVRGARPRVPVPPRAQADRDRRERPDRHGVRAAGPADGRAAIRVDAARASTSPSAAIRAPRRSRGP